MDSLDETYNEEQAAIKFAKDTEKMAILTEADKQKIREDTEVLKQRQEEAQGNLPTALISYLLRSIDLTNHHFG